MPKHLLRSLRHALHGLRLVWHEERNFRIHIVAAVIVFLAMGLLHFSPTEAALFTMMILLVLGAEIVNTLLENLLDIIEPRHHTAVGRMKDMMAGVVLLLSCGSLLVALFVFLAHFS